MILRTNPAVQVMLLTSALCVADVAAAALKDKPPAGLNLSATAWQIDPYHSDDPVAVIQNAEYAEQQRRNRDRDGLDRGGMDRGGMDRQRPGPGGDDPFGRGFPDSSSRSGNWPNPGRPATTIDPTGGVQSATIQFGSRSSNPFLEQLNRNPQQLAFRQVEEHVTVTEDGLETDCTAGEKASPLSDSFGDGERKCGWSGRAWVVETTRSHHFTRVDRYELSKDGKSLRYTTTASGSDIPSVRITRMYEVARHPN
ncbi:MAG: hypothetical protein WDO56_17810 [Gammaproteobacteria bacterium]